MAFLVALLVSPAPPDTSAWSDPREAREVFVQPAPVPNSFSFPSIDQAASGNVPTTPFGQEDSPPTITVAPHSHFPMTWNPEDVTRNQVPLEVGREVPNWPTQPAEFMPSLGEEIKDPFRLASTVESAQANIDHGNEFPGQTIPSWQGQERLQIPGAIDKPSPSIHGRRVSNWRGLLRRKFGVDQGLGFERVAFAPMVLDTAITSPYAGLRIRSNRGLTSPDRLEYVWSRTGKGPGPESRVDWIDSMFRTELGNDKAAVISEIGMRALNPELNPNTVGFADMLVGAKATVYDGKCTKISSIFLTHINTGPADRGLGTGHFSLEPGLLARHRWSDRTYLHGELKYRIPIAGSANFAGDVLTSGWGLSTIWKDGDQFALIPTLELQTHSFLFGSRTDVNGVVQRVDSVTALELFPGIRCAFARSAMGTMELGTAAGFTVADRDWIDTRIMFELRWLR